MIAYKGFNKDLSCRGIKFKKNKTNITKEANCVKNGFHCATDPMDCLSYYPNWDKSVYYIVSADGDIHEEGTSDTKISCTHLTLVEKLTKESFMKEALMYIASNPKLSDNAHKDKGDKRNYYNCPFVLVRGINPVAKGELGDVLGFVKDKDKNKEVDELGMWVIDGVNILPDTYYDIHGKKVQLV